jgi:alanyl-tRNA synthetase
MQTAEIARRFLDYFTSRGHTLVPSASVIAEDPTLLLVNAGMVPFKPYFLGQVTPPFPRAASIQKCIRTPDIDVVGTTTRHTTFFPMAGNFSFGDYFKELAIPFAWELLTAARDAGGFGLDPQRLWATVYQDDDDAFAIWTGVVGLPSDRVQRRGKADNYWQMGVPGPGGPSSEIYYDRGPDYGPEGGPVVDEERFLEVWNLVFMQEQLSAVRSKEDFDVLGPLPARNIDTGMGIERMSILLQGVDNVFETDLLRPLLDLAGRMTGVAYGADAGSDVRLRVVADHIRTSTVLIADGVTPGNEGRGYVLRRLLRRAVRTLRLLGAERPAISELITAAVQMVGGVYPELRADLVRIEAVAVAEEAAFLETLRTGSVLFERVTADLRQSGSTTVRGEQAFALHDTYGFPIDLTLEMAAEAGLQVDEAGFARLMAEQRDRAKRDSQERKTGHVDLSAYRTLHDVGGPSDFTGYVEPASESTILGLLVAGAPADMAREGDVVEVTLDRTPFYAEGGGQLADRGRITLADGSIVEVDDVQRPPGLTDLIVHKGRVVRGEVTRAATGVAEVDTERRRAISRAHTATHLVHAGMRRALGETAAQAGSLNDAGRFRFDFASAQAVPDSVLADVEAEINAVLLGDVAVRAFVTTQDEAQRLGAIAMFGEKYGDAVRVVEVGDYSRELCGGTHAARSSQLGVVKLLSESSIGTGKRRVEGLVGMDAFDFLAREHVLVSQLSESLKARPEELPDRIAATVARLRDAERELGSLRSAAVLATAGTIASQVYDEFGVAVIAHRTPDGTSGDDLRTLAVDVRGRLGNERPAVVALAAVTSDRPLIVVATNEAARQWGLSAGELVRIAAEQLGGKGGGRDDLAQGGGTDAGRVEDALNAARYAVGRRVTGSG